MQFIKDFFDFLYNEMIDLNHLDAIHDIAKRIVRNEGNELCQAFETWYAETVYSDDE